jgi:Flp pilus assembly pilin Flp
MAQDTRVGKPRSFLRGFLLTVVTLGLYGIYWNYQAHDEVFEQWNLDEKGEDQGVLFLVLGLIFAPLLWVYQYKFVENVNAARAEAGLEEGVTAVEFLLWAIVGAIILVGPIVAYYKLQTSINEAWEALETGGPAAGAGDDGTRGADAPGGFENEAVAAPGPGAE